MIVFLDTNILSELMRAKPEPRVVAWLDAQNSQTIWLPSIVVFEVRYGLERMPSGSRRAALESAFEATLRYDFAGRIAAFDEAAAQEAGSLAAASERAGRPIDMRDLMIAGIVKSRGATLATRNTRDFEIHGLALVDPWLHAL
jgi:predicted nucleic acid-binding protein